MVLNEMDEEESEKLRQFLEEPPTHPLNQVQAYRNTRRKNDYPNRVRNSIFFGNPNVPAIPKTIQVAKEQKFQSSVLQSKTETSWDRPITDYETRSLTDEDFHALVRVVGEDVEKCQHVIIHTSCECSEGRMLGVCGKCYQVYCNEKCLKKGLTHQGARVGMSSKNALKGNFGIVATANVETTGYNGCLLPDPLWPSGPPPPRTDRTSDYPLGYLKHQSRGRGLRNSDSRLQNAVGGSRSLLHGRSVNSTYLVENGYLPELSSASDEIITTSSGESDVVIQSNSVNIGIKDTKSRNLAKEKWDTDLEVGSHFDQYAINLEAEVPLGVPTVMHLTHIAKADEFYFKWIRPNHSSNRDKSTITSNWGGKLEKLKSTFEQMNKAEIRIGGFCIVEFDGDEINSAGFKRGKILGRSTNGFNTSFKVKLVDIGLCKVYQECEIFSIPEELLHHRRDCFRLMAQEYVSNPGRSEEISKFVKEVLTNLSEQRKNHFLVCVNFIATAVKLKNADEKDANFWGTFEYADVKGKTPAEFAIDSGHGKNRGLFDKDLKNIENFTPTVSSDAINTPKHLNVGSLTRVRLCSWPTSYNDFFVIEESREMEMTEIQKSLYCLMQEGNICYKPWESSNPSEWGSFCCVQHEGKWHRGRVRHIKSDFTALVLLIDTGLTKTFKMSNLSEIPNSLKRKAPLAVQCCLPISLAEDVPMDQRANQMELAMKRFRRLEELRGDIDVYVFSIDKDTHVVDLHIVPESTSICEALIEVKAAKVLVGSGISDKHIKSSAEKLRQSTILSSSATSDWSTKAKLYGMQPENPMEVELLASIASNASTGLLRSGSAFNYSQLIELPPLNALTGRQFLFNHFVGFNILTLMEHESGEENLKVLQDVISRWVSYGNPPKLVALPESGDVVLCPYLNSYRRAVFESTSKSGALQLRLIDYGTQTEIPTFDILIQPSVEIIKIPLFVHFVRLFGVADDVPILLDHFKELRSKNNRVAVLKEVHSNDTESSSSLPVVSLSVQDGTSLSELINQLAIWKWKKYYRAMYRTFDEVSQVNGDAFISKDQYLTEYTLPKTRKQATWKVRVQYSVTSGCDTFAYIYCVPYDALVHYQSRSVCYQLQQFMTKIDNPIMTAAQVKEYPHLMCLKPREAVAMNYLLKNVWSLCTWHRAFYSSQTEEVMCVDCLWKTDKLDGLEIYRLTQDFYDACPTGIIVKMNYLKDSDKGKRLTKKYFPRGRELKICLKSRVPDVSNGLFFYNAKVVN